MARAWQGNFRSSAQLLGRSTVGATEAEARRGSPHAVAGASVGATQEGGGGLVVVVPVGVVEGQGRAGLQARDGVHAALASGVEAGHLELQLVVGGHLDEGAPTESAFEPSAEPASGGRDVRSLTVRRSL